jgi:hypothetical protein
MLETIAGLGFSSLVAVTVAKELLKNLLTNAYDEGYEAGQADLMVDWTDEVEEFVNDELA